MHSFVLLSLFASLAVSGHFVLTPETIRPTDPVGYGLEARQQFIGSARIAAEIEPRGSVRLRGNEPCNHRKMLDYSQISYASMHFARSSGSAEATTIASSVQLLAFGVGNGYASFICGSDSQGVLIDIGLTSGADLSDVGNHAFWLITERRRHRLTFALNKLGMDSDRFLLDLLAFDSADTALLKQLHSGVHEPGNRISSFSEKHTALHD